MIYNAVDIYSMILVAFAVMSWFPGAYESSLGRWIVALVKPVLAPLQRLPLQIAGLDLSVSVAIVLLRFLGANLVRFHGDDRMNKSDLSAFLHRRSSIS